MRPLRTILSHAVVEISLDVDSYTGRAPKSILREETAPLPKHQNTVNRKFYGITKASIRLQNCHSHNDNQ